MRKLLLIGIMTLVLGCLCVLPCQAQRTLDGDWTGGIDFGKTWQSIDLHVQSGKDGIKGTLDFPGQNLTKLPVDRIVFEPPHLRIEWQGKSGLSVFDGLLKGEAISGRFTQGEQTATFALVRVAKIDPRLYEQISGSYHLGRDRFIDIGPTSDSARFLDSKTRRTGYLFPSSETTFFSGPSVGIPVPVEIRITFVRNAQGEVTGLIWKENGARGITGKKILHQHEEVSYRYGDATLTATLILPATKGPHPALIDVGQGYFLSRHNGLEQYFYARQGLAVLTPIRRTVGGSDANYLKSSFDERAREVLAGVEMLKGRPDINPRQIGLYGDSQTAWIAPLAATFSSDVAFLILRVPSALPVTENILYEIETNLRRDNFSEADISHTKALRRLIHKTILTNTDWETLKAEIDKSKSEKWFPYARAGWFPSLKIPPDEKTARDLRDPLTYDPLPVLEKVTVPVLAMNGELDEAVPTSQSVPILERALRKAGNKDFTIVVLPRAGHNFLETDKPYGAEQYVRKKRYVSGYWETITAWLRKHVTRNARQGR
jgi:dienelactone hydrolase